MSESIVSKKLSRLLRSSQWTVSEIKYNRHYSTGKIIACSVYCDSGKALKVSGWLYFHEKQIIEGSERGIQFSFTKPFSRSSLIFNVPASKISIHDSGRNSMEITLHDILLEDMTRATIKMCLIPTDKAIKLIEIKAYFDNNCQ